MYIYIYIHVHSRAPTCANEDDSPSVFFFARFTWGSVQRCALFEAKGPCKHIESSPINQVILRDCTYVSKVMGVTPSHHPID